MYRFEFEIEVVGYHYQTNAMLYFGDTNTADWHTWFSDNGRWPGGTRVLAEWGIPHAADTGPESFTLFWDNTGDSTWTPENPPAHDYGIIHAGDYSGGLPVHLGDHLRFGTYSAGYGTAVDPTYYLDNVTAAYLEEGGATGHLGDANLDDVVDLQDFGLLKDNFGLTVGATWAQGDFNADEQIDLQDFGILKDHFGHTTGDNPLAAVPEPATLALLAMGGLGSPAKTEVVHRFHRLHR